MAKTLEETQNIVASHLDKILEEFLPGRKITVIVRTPGDDSADFLMTDEIGDEGLEEAMILIQRRIDNGHEG